MQNPYHSIAKGLLLLAGCGLSVLCVEQNSRAAEGVQIQELTDRLRVELNGKLFTEYYFKDTPRPYCYPLIGPDGLAMTRNWPMKDVPDEDHDHPHHRSLWFTHGDVNGVDFWTERKTSGKIVHRKFKEVKSGKDFGVIVSQNDWISPDNKTICTDELTVKIYPAGANDERTVDYEITIHASNGDLTFGDTKEGTMAVRVAETMRLKGKVGKGHILNSAGVRDDETWGKRADWCLYTGPVDGKTVSVAMFDHPQNPRHPTWWHVRDYGLFAANPFGKHDFEKLTDKTAGNLVVPSGKSITFRYRVMLLPGDPGTKIAEKYQLYCK